MSKVVYEISYDGETWKECARLRFPAPCAVSQAATCRRRPLAPAELATKGQIIFGGSPRLQFQPERSTPGLPEEAPKPAVPPLEEQVPVGSRWRQTRGVAEHLPFTVVAKNFLGQALVVHYDDDPRDVTYDFSAAYAAGDFATYHTRLDEPAGTGKARVTYKITGPDGKLKEVSPDEYYAWMLANGGIKRIVAMPPARCAPGCIPSRACRIIIPVTDKGTRYECPAFAEDEVLFGSERFGYWTEKHAGAALAREMRDQRWEPMNAGPMAGRYRFDRRPR